MSPLGAMVAGALPDPFYSTLSAEVDLRAAIKVDSSMVPAIQGILGELLDIKPPSTIHCTVGPQDEEGRVTSRGEVRLSSGSNMTVAALRDILEQPETLTAISAKLEQLVASRRLGIDLGSEAASAANATLCQVGALICCERLTVLAIVANAGIFIPYKSYFTIAMILCLLVAFVAALACLRARALKHPDREALRVSFVTPLLIIGVVTNSCLLAFKSYEKYFMLVDHCEKDPSDMCPPSKGTPVMETVIFAGLNLALLFVFLCWWNPRLPGRREVAGPLQQATLMPLESVLRRSALLAALEVRPTDRTTRLEEVLLSINKLFLTFAVGMLGFFALQRYQMPGRLLAWNPYKMVIEIGAATVLGIAVKDIVRNRRFGSSTNSFLVLSTVGFIVLDVALWVSLFRIYLDMYKFPWNTDHVCRILDIAIGAGLLNFQLSAFSTAFSLHLFSAYVYEPLFRRRHVASFCLTTPKEHEQFQSLSNKGEVGREVVHAPTVYGKRVHLASLHGDEAVNDENLCASSALEGPVFVELWRPGVPLGVQAAIKVADMCFTVDKVLPIRSQCIPLGSYDAEDSADSETSSDAE